MRRRVAAVTMYPLRPKNRHRRSRAMAATEKAILAGGCFWGVQDLIRKLDGVTGTRVGYTGGDTPNATYRNHGTHAEAIEILFDPDRITYRDLLEFFFQIHDPTTKNRLPRRRKHAPGPATEVLAPMRTNGNALPRRRPVPRHPGIYYRPRPGGKVAPPYEISYLDSTGRRRWMV